jgi:hypothetical protein
LAGYLTYKGQELIVKNGKKIINKCVELALDELNLGKWNEEWKGLRTDFYRKKCPYSTNNGNFKNM